MEEAIKNQKRCNNRLFSAFSTLTDRTSYKAPSYDYRSKNNKKKHTYINFASSKDILSQRSLSQRSKNGIIYLKKGWATNKPSKMRNMYTPFTTVDNVLNCEAFPKCKSSPSQRTTFQPTSSHDHTGGAVGLGDCGTLLPCLLHPSLRH